MKNLLKPLALAGIAFSTALVAPAAAQVQGNVATLDVATTVVGTTAFQNAYNSIGTTYQSQIDSRRQLQEQRQAQLATLDTNNDNEVDDAELQAAQGSAALTQIQQLEQQIAALTAQVDGARVYAIEQVLAQYPAALQEVVTADQIQVVLTPDALIYAATDADITRKVSASLNTKVTSVGVVPPAGWQPQRNSVALFQQIQQLLLTAQAIQARQAAQQQAQQPATQAPAGR